MASGGGLLDLVARGKKDTYFTENPKISFIHSVYTRASPSTQEIRYTFPKNVPAWGQYIEFDIEHIGDIMRNPTLLIDLPTWLPPTQALKNPSAFTSDISGVEYGYCHHIGILMIDKIQVYAGQYLLQEFWGQWLSWRAAMDKKATVYGSVIGNNPSLCKRATPGQIRIYLPILGNQTEGDKGFPHIALSGQNFTIRVFLKRLEEVVEASDGRLNPSPWAKTLYQITKINEKPEEFQTLPRSLVKGPTIILETTQVYLPREAQELLKRTPFQVPFAQTQRIAYTIEDSKWNPLIASNITISIPVTLDFVGAAGRLMVAVQSEAALRSGQLYNISPPPGETTQFLQTLRLNTGSIDRLNEFDVTLWRDVSNYYKNARAPSSSSGSPLNVYTLTFGGETDSNQPMGTFNLSRSTTQVLYATLAPISIEPRLNSRKAYIIIFAETWNLYEIKDGKGRLKFAD
jgi:hypothetical protein